MLTQLIKNTRVMKEENIGDTSQTPGQPPQPINLIPPFDPQDRTGPNQRPKQHSTRSDSNPPPRDMSGKRVDVDDIRNFGIELW